MTAKYDYVAEAQHAALYVNQREAEQKTRKVLRKLVRASVMATMPRDLVVFADHLKNWKREADRIARELVPGSQKRGRQ